ncbi:hypothetical protein TrCOL_g3525 [Triparma columacea]|uniref:Fe2OG dioxygenase domain-containing protein n=1 Tax=Triparma columacea TaxID=722753 RepID=A0A9W7L2R6_9STRA|nr:hypothetical protein TrCOL_g3525 [Triparma columacea]
MSMLPSSPTLSGGAPSMRTSWSPLRMVKSRKAKKGKRLDKDNEGKDVIVEEPVKVAATGPSISPPESPSSSLSIDSNSTSISSFSPMPVGILTSNLPAPSMPPLLPSNLPPLPNCPMDPDGEMTGFVEITIPAIAGGPTISPASMRMIGNTKIFEVDASVGCFVFQALTPDECDALIRIAEDHAQKAEQADKPMAIKGWRKLYTYTSMDLPVQDIRSSMCNGPDLKSWLMEKICKVAGAYYGCHPNVLKPRTWKEPHFLKYTTDCETPHCGVEMHYDGCNLSYSVMLSRISEYTGGGTYIRCLKKTIKLSQGQVLIHPGELFHKGVDITDGTRYLVVCFVDGFDPGIPDPSSAKGAHDAFEGNTVRYFD